MIPAKTIEELILKHSTLEKDLSSGEIDKKLFAEKSKEYSDLNEIIINAKKYLSYEEDKKDLEKILNDSSVDKELKEMAELELTELKTEFEINEKKLKLFLLPKDEADKKNAIIEIRAGTGGLEASLFASDLFKMYEKVSHKKKWTLELISINKSFLRNWFSLAISTVKIKSAGVLAPSASTRSNKPFFACKTFTLIPVFFVNSSKKGLIRIGCL